MGGPRKTTPVKNDDSEQIRIDNAFAKIRRDFDGGQACESEVSQLQGLLESFAQSDCDTACCLMTICGLSLIVFCSTMCATALICGFCLHFNAPGPAPLR